MSGFGKTEKSILSVALIILVAFSYFLYDDSLLFPKDQNNQLELIGAVAVSQNDVRRKNLDTFSWVPAAKKDNVYQNDSIYTGDRSEASVQLQDGTQIKIQPNSLITLNLKNGQMNLDLRYGNLVGTLAQGSSLTVKSGADEFKLENSEKGGSDIQFNKSHSGTVDLKLLSGGVKYINKNKTQDLPKNAPVAVNAGDIKQLTAPELVLLTEDNTTWVRATPQDPLPFAWEGKGNIGRYQIEIAPTEDFKNIAVKKTTSEQNLQVIEPLEPGHYYWRVKAADTNGRIAATTPFRKFTLSNISAPQITYPQQASEVKLEVLAKPQETLTSETEVQWQGPATFKSFTWQISQDPEFTTVLREAATPQLSARTPKLPSGQYWVRVRGETDKNVQSPWSEPVNFQLNLVAQTGPERPILITKDIEFRPPTADRLPASPEAPQLAWKPVLKSKNYHVQISKDKSFETFERLDSTNSQIEWSKFKPGKHFYRVFARGQNGILSAPSEVGSIEVTLNNPVLNPLPKLNVIDNKAGPRETNISWSEIPFAKSYLVQFDKSKDFKAPRQLQYNSASGKLQLPEPGQYHVRVQAVDETNEPLTGFSNIQEVLYNHRAPLTAPPLLEPFNQASIFLQTQMEPFIWLEWKKVEGATVYQLEVSDKPDFSRTLIKKSISANRYLIKERVPLGKIYWRVRAEAKETAESSEWTEKREFTIYHQKNETFIK